MSKWNLTPGLDRNGAKPERKKMMCSMRWLMHGLRAHSHSASMTASMFISLHIRSMWETICDAQQAGFWLNSKFLSKFSRKPLSGISDQKAPPPPTNEELQIWDDQSLLWPPPPPIGKLQIWDDQSLLRNTPPPPRRLAIRCHSLVNW